VESYINHTTGKADENSIFNGDIALFIEATENIFCMIQFTIAR
jgi:hypothetical protein